jgi:hypothetical protein
MSRDDDDHRSNVHGMVGDAKWEAFHARRALRRELPSPSPEAKSNVAAALSDYRDVLWDYREEGALEIPWDDRPINVDEVDRYLNEKTVVQKRVNRRGNVSEKNTVPLIHKVPAQNLFAIGKELDAMAKELGFAEKPKSDTGDLYGVKRDPQEYPEPKKDGIQKPQ